MKNLIFYILAWIHSKWSSDLGYYTAAEVKNASPSTACQAEQLKEEETSD